MSPPERFPANDPREWMNRARSSLAMAKNRIPEVYLEDLCFRVHQAADRTIKAVMIKRSVDFPYVHDLARLLSLLEEGGERIPEMVATAEELTPYASVTRYPGTVRPVGEQDYIDAVNIAEVVIRWAEERVK